MMPGMDPRMMRQAMKKMGISQEDLDAQAVIIVLGDRKIVFENPSVQKVTMQGEESFQISGVHREEAAQGETTIDKADVESVMEQTGASREDAKAALEAAGGDLAAAIIKLSE